MLARLLHDAVRMAAGQCLRRGALLACVALAACGGGSSGDRSNEALRTRLIAGSPPEPLTASRWMVDEPVFRWTFRSDADIAPWTAEDVERFEIDGDGVVVQSTGVDPRLTRAVTIDASEVHAIRVVMGPNDPNTKVSSAAQLFWAGPEQPFSEARSESTRVIEAGQTTYVFPVGRNPEWAGAIARLRFDPTKTPGLAMRVREIVGVRRRIDAAALEQLADTAWRVDLGNEVRSARVVPIGTPLEWTVHVPQDGRLRFSRAVWRELAAPLPGADPLVLEVTVTPTDGQPERVLSETMAATSPSRPWKPVDIDLSAYAGQSITIAVAAKTGTPIDPLRGLLVVANPEVVAVDRADAPINVVLISIDTLRADHLSLYGYDRPTSPHIDAWAARTGVVFDNAFSQAPWTLPSHVSMLTGLDPLRHGANYDRPIPADLSMLAERLRDAGHATAAVTGGVFLHPRYGFDQGFDRYHYWYSQGGPPLIMELDDAAKRARTYLRNHTDEPFFLFLHTYAVHSPYWYREDFLEQIDGPPMPGPARNVNLVPAGEDWKRAFVHRHEARWHGPNAPGEPPLEPSEIPVMVRLYDAGIRYADERIGSVLAELDALGLTERTLVVLTSDHGEMMGEHDEFSHASLRDPVLRVPLVVALPSRFPGGRRVEAQVRSVDITPTILDVVGLPPATETDGVSLVPWLTGSGETPPLDAWAYAPHPNLGVSLRVGNRRKYVFNDAALAPIAGDEQLYSLADDATETTDVATTDTETATLRSRVRAHLDARPGLRAAIANGSAQPLRLALEGPAVYPTRLKVLEAGCRCVDWKRKSAIVSLPPGATLTLLLDDVTEQAMTVRPFAGPGDTLSDFALTLDPDDTTGPWGAELTDTGWQLLDAPEHTPATGIRIWWQGATRATPDVRPTDPELVQQLRTLGYVE